MIRSIVVPVRIRPLPVLTVLGALICVFMILAFTTKQPPPDTFRPGLSKRLSSVDFDDPEYILKYTLEEAKTFMLSNESVRNSFSPSSSNQSSCGSYACWEDFVHSLMDENNTIIVYCASIEYGELMSNFRCRLQTLGINNAVLVALDEKTYLKAKKSDIPVLFDASFDLGGQRARGCDIFRSKCFTLRTHLKTLITVRMLMYGANVLFSDVDVVWLKNPVSHLWGLSQPGQLLIQSDDPRSDPVRMVNSGFFFARNDSLTLSTFVLILRLAVGSPVTQQPIFDGVLCGAEKNQDGAIPYPCLSTACGMRNSNFTCLANNTFRTKTLDRETFPHGRWRYYFSATRIDKEFAHIYVIHNNWIVGLPSKIGRLRAHRLWEWNATAMECQRDPPAEYGRLSIPSRDEWARLAFEKVPEEQKLHLPPRTLVPIPTYRLVSVVTVSALQRYSAELALSYLPADSVPPPLPSPKSIVFITHPWARYLGPEEKSLEYAYIDKTLPALKQYTQRYGYDLFYNYPFNGGSAPMLGKLRSIRSFMDRDYQWIVWIDIDVLITNPFLSLDSFFFYATDATHFIWTPECTVPRGEPYTIFEDTLAPPVNSKLMIFRNSEEGLNFLSLWDRYLRRLGYGSIPVKTTKAFEKLALYQAISYLNSKPGQEKNEIHLPAYMMQSSVECFQQGHFSVQYEPKIERVLLNYTMEDSVLVKTKEKNGSPVKGENR